MPSLGMTGPFIFNKDSIEKNVKPNIIGNYALGYVNTNTNVFIVLYVGRSDSDLQGRLIQHIGEDERFKHFKFVIQTSILDAYYCECKNYHDFGGEEGRLLNENHPARPANIARNCPYCGK